MAKLVLLTLHGMGAPDPHYADPLQEGLRDRLGATLWREVSVQPVWYSPVFQTREEALWSDMVGQASNELDSTALRKLFLYGFADAAAFERSAKAEPESYQAIMKIIMAALAKGFKACGSKADTPLLIVAQSLGGQVISSYFYDAQKSQYLFDGLPGSGDPGLDEFVRLKTLRQLVTTGCNIPIFLAGMQQRINFARVPASLEWDNYYDPDDVLGWPLRQLDPVGGTYGWVRDHPISAGNFLTGWNPASHLGYWTDKDVMRPLAASIKMLLA